MNYTLSYLSTLPDSVLLEEIFPQLSLEYLSKLCIVNSRFNNICVNDRLWQLKTQYEYPNKITSKPKNISWKSYYQHLVNFIRKIDILITNKLNYKYEIDLYHKSTISSLQNQILDLARRKGFDVDHGYILQFYKILPRMINISPRVSTDRFNISIVTPNSADTVGSVKDINYAELFIDLDDMPDYAIPK